MMTKGGSFSDNIVKKTDNCYYDTQPMEISRMNRHLKSRIDGSDSSNSTPIPTRDANSQNPETQESESMAGPPLSWLSLPLPQSQSQSSEDYSPLVEETQLQDRRRRCEAMGRSDWEQVKANHSGFKSAIAELVLACNSENNETKWLPPLLRNDTTLSL